MLQETKELNIPRRNLISKEDRRKAIKNTIIKYKEIVFGVNSPICIKYLDELRKHHMIGKKVYDQKLMHDAEKKLVWKCSQKNTIVNGDMIIDIRTGEDVGPGVDYTLKF